MCHSAIDPSLATATVVVHPLPLAVTECDVWALLSRVTEGDGLARREVSAMEMTRDGTVSLTQAVSVRFRSVECAVRCATLLDGRLYQGHRMRVRFSDSPVDAWPAESACVRLCGFPADCGLNTAKVRNYLAALGVDCEVQIGVRYRYSVAPYACVRFPMLSLAQDAHSALCGEADTDYICKERDARGSAVRKGARQVVMRRCAVFARFATGSQFAESCRRTSVKNVIDSVARTSETVQVSGLAWDVSEEEVADLFEGAPAMDVSRVSLLWDRHLGPTCARVQFVEEASALRAVTQWNGLVTRGGQPISVRLHLRQTAEDRKTLRMLESLRDEEVGEERRALKKAATRRRKRANQKRRIREVVRRVHATQERTRKTREA